jgi:hypothetical protein
MARNGHHCVILLLFSLLIPTTFLLAGSQTEGWSSEELTVAKQLGLNLNPTGGAFRNRSVGEQTWLSPGLWKEPFIGSMKTFMVPIIRR